MVIMHTEVSVIYPHLKSFLGFVVVWEVITLSTGRDVLELEVRQYVVWFEI
jgi:hypothetical protein